LPDGRHLVAGGKLKDRKRWSAHDEDNHILPCPVKVRATLWPHRSGVAAVLTTLASVSVASGAVRQLFDITTGEVVQQFAGHDEEILYIELCRYRGESYMLTSSQDGHIIKWRMSPDYTEVLELTKMGDKKTCMAFMVSFVPGTGNRYFLGACDEYVRLYDFEHAQVSGVDLVTHGQISLPHKVLAATTSLSVCVLSCCKRSMPSTHHTATLCSL